jgi:heptosyltransferase III
MKNANKPQNVQDIVILRTDRIGEVLLSTPVIEALKRNFPKARINFITSPYARDIISDRADIDKVLTFDTICNKASSFDAFKLAKKLSMLSCDMAIVLNPHKVLHLGVFLAGIRYRVGFERKWGFLLNAKAEDTRDKAKMHEVNYNLQLLRLLDIYEEGIMPFMPVLSKSSFYVKGLLEQTGVTGKKRIVAIHPGSSNPSKIFPIDKFKEVIKALVEPGAIDIVIIGSREEKALCAKIKSGLGRDVHDLSGLFTLRKLAAMCKASDLFITNDNGPMHIAAAVGTKVLALFNRDAVGSNPLRWGPYGEGHVVIYKSFKSITPDEIAEKAKAML